MKYIIQKSENTYKIEFINKLTKEKERVYKIRSVDQARKIRDKMLNEIEN